MQAKRPSAPTFGTRWEYTAFALAAFGVPIIALAVDTMIWLLLGGRPLHFLTALFALASPAYVLLGLPAFALAIRKDPEGRHASNCVYAGMLANLVGSFPLYTVITLMAGAEAEHALALGICAMVVGFVYGWVHCLLFGGCYGAALRFLRWLARPWPPAPSDAHAATR